MFPAAQVSHNHQEAIAQVLGPEKVLFQRPVQLNQSKAAADSRILVMTPWRAYVFYCRHPVKVESSFSYLEVYAITVGNINQLVIETDRQSYSLCLMTMADLEAVVSHVTASLKKIFPDSSPGKLLKKVPVELQEQLQRLTTTVEDQLKGTQGPCGGFSETYAALCDFNEFPCREEVQWDVDNIYHVQNCRDFNLLDFSYLDSRDLALAVAALSFNQWFTKISNKDFRLSPEVQEQVLYMINRSTKLEEVCLENSGLRSDFALRMAWALRDHMGSILHTINLSANQIEDKGVMALSQQLEKLPNGLNHLSLAKVSVSPRGVASLAQAFSQKPFSTSLHHLDLSGNTGSLATEEATFLFKFLSGENEISYLDLSGTDCPLDALFVSLSSGCCFKLTHLSLSRNVFSHRKVKEVTRSVREFFSRSEKLKFVGLSGTRFPAEALRLLLQGLTTNTQLSGLKLDLSCCELRSAGAQVIQEHIFEAKAISSLDLSDNGLENDMVTLILSIGRSHSIRHLALGRNFAMKSRALSDVLHRIVQLIQEEECPLESLSVSDSKLKTGTTILINSLGRNSSLTKIDISGNCIGDTGAKMLAKALLINTKLRTLVWDRNNVTASGLMDVANALEKNCTLQHMTVPMSDICQAYRSNPEKAEEALQKIQTYLLRNCQRQEVMSDHALQLQQGLRTSQSEQLVQGLCLKVQENIHPLTTCSMQEVQSDILSAEEVLHHAKTSISLLPALFELGRASPNSDVLQNILKDTARLVTKEVTEDIQELVQNMLQHAQSTCPRVVQRSSVSEQMTACTSRKFRQAALCFQDMLVEQTGELIRRKLSELRQAVSVSLAESIIDEVMQDLSASQQKLEWHIKEYTQSPASSASSIPRINIPRLRLVEDEFPIDEYVPVVWRTGFPTGSIRPAPSVKSLLDQDTDSQANESTAGQVRSQPPYPTEAAAAQSTEPSHILAPLDLPVNGQTLRHHTRSRPRPHRTHRQPPNKLQQEHVPQGENTSGMDEGLEEFFTKKIISGSPVKPHPPDLPEKAETTEGSSVATKELRKKVGDFFAFKRIRAGRTAKGEGAVERNLKKTSIADLIRPLRDVVRVEKEREKEERAAKTEPRDRVIEESIPKRPTSLVMTSSFRDTPTSTATPTVSPTPLLSSESEKRLGSSLRALREAKAQSLILLPYLDPPAPHENKDGELRKAESEGNIDNFDPDPPSTHLKAHILRTSADTRPALRPPALSQERLRGLVLAEWPAPPDRPCPPPPPRPPAKPSPVTCEVPIAPLRQKRPPTVPRRREAPPIPADVGAGRDRAHSVTEADTLPKPRPRMRPLSQHQATSVHEACLHHQLALLNTNALTAVPPPLPRSPMHKRPPPKEPRPCSTAQSQEEEAGPVMMEERSIAGATEQLAGWSLSEGETTTKKVGGGTVPLLCSVRRAAPPAGKGNLLPLPQKHKD